LFIRVNGRSVVLAKLGELKEQPRRQGAPRIWRFRLMEDEDQGFGAAVLDAQSPSDAMKIQWHQKSSYDRSVEKAHSIIADVIFFFFLLFGCPGMAVGEMEG
jgi:hypothetical protein